MRFLSDDETVVQLLRLMKESGREATGAELSCLVAALDSMEQQYSAVLAELQGVKKQLEQTQAPSAGDRLLGAIQAAQDKVGQALKQLAAVKEKVITWAKSVLEDVRRLGIGALDGALSTLGVHKLLESMGDKVSRAMEGVSAAVERAEAMGQELRSAGGHLKNAGRAAVGKETRQIDGGQAGRVQAVVLAPPPRGPRLPLRHKPHDQHGGGGGTPAGQNCGAGTGEAGAALRPASVGTAESGDPRPSRP